MAALNRQAKAAQKRREIQAGEKRPQEGTVSEAAGRMCPTTQRNKGQGVLNSFDAVRANMAREKAKIKLYAPCESLSVEEYLERRKTELQQQRE